MEIQILVYFPLLHIHHILLFVNFNHVLFILLSHFSVHSFI